jgi:hypothetical protein
MAAPSPSSEARAKDDKLALQVHLQGTQQMDHVCAMRNYLCLNRCPASTTAQTGTYMYVTTALLAELQAFLLQLANISLKA